jgi:riboflavin kinase
MLIRGEVTSGKGEGRLYIVKNEYAEQFRKAFGFVPFPGTLNLVVTEKNYENFQSLKKRKGIKISGFEKDGERFGEVNCFNCILNGIMKGVVVIPEKSRYDDVMEIASDKNLRYELSLSDGDKVDVFVE